MESQTRTFEGYTVLLHKSIGKGTYAEVFECQSKHDSDQQLSLCAKLLEVYDQSSVKEKDILKILIAQAKFNANIVSVKKIIDVKHENLIVIIMERCLGSLQEELEKEQKFSNEEVKDFLKQILQGYAPLNKYDIIHRDIKPANILIVKYDGKKIFKLADFGVGKILQQNNLIITKTGTPAYAPPEINLQWTKDDQLIDDLKSLSNGKSQIDMYSIGIILYQLLFGTLPFEANREGVRTFIQSLKNKSFKIQPQENSDAQLLQTIEKLFEYYPSKRPTFQQLFSQFCLQAKPQITKIQFPKSHQQLGGSPLQFQQFRFTNPQPSGFGQQKEIVKQQDSCSFNFLQRQTFLPQKPSTPFFVPADKWLKVFREILQNYVDINSLMCKQCQENDAVSLMKKTINSMNDKIAFKQAVLQLKQHFKFEKNYPYSDQQIKLLFSLKFYNDEYKQQQLDPSTLSIIQMKSYLA